MKFNKVTWAGILMPLVGLQQLFRTTPYPIGAKHGCKLGNDCLYMGGLLIIIGLIILISEYYKQNKS